jgi:hypothetical protein
MGMTRRLDLPRHCICVFAQAQQPERCHRKLMLHTEMQRYETQASLAHFLSDRSPKRERD